MTRMAPDGTFWRGMAAMGARRFPRWWMRYSPPVFGVAAAALLPDARRAVRANLARIRGPAPGWRDAVDTARTFATYASCLSEALARGSKNERPIDATYDGSEHMRDAIARGKGVLLLTMHTAGWDIAPPLYAHFNDVDVLVVMMRERSAGAEKLHKDARTELGTKVVHVGDDALAALPIMRHLEKKGAVGIQIDRPPPNGRTITARLFGEPYPIPEGPLRIAQLSGAPMLPVFSARRGFHTYHVRQYPPITLPRRATREELEHAAQAIAAAMEDFLRRYPTQWFQFRSWS